MGFIDTWKTVIQTPSNFFENMPTSGGYEKPLKFAVICYIPLAILSILAGLITFDVTTILSSPLLLLLGVIAVLIQSFFVHIGVIIFAKENMKEFESTVRVVSYSSAVVLITNSVSWIPVIGTLISIPFTLYGIYLGVVGIMKVHQTTGFRAAMAYLSLLIAVGILVTVVIISAIYTNFLATY